MIPHRRAAELAAASIDFPLSDGEQAELSEHLAACDDCRRLAGSLRSDATQVRTLPTYRPSERVLGTILAEGRSRRGRAGRPFAVLAATALLTVALLGSALIGAELTRPRVLPSPSITAAPSASLVAGPTASPTVSAIASPDGSPDASPSPSDNTASPPPTPSLSPGPVTGWRQVLRLDETSGVQGVVATSDGFVAVGFRSVGEGGRGSLQPRAWLSPDGRAWQEVSLGGDGSGPFSAISTTSGGGVIAATQPRAEGEAGRLWTSPDGRRWQPLPTGALLRDATVRALVPLDEQVLAIGSVRSEIGSLPAIWRGSGARWERVERLGLPGDEEGFVLTTATRVPDGARVLAEDVRTSERPRAVILGSRDGATWSALPDELDGGPHAPRGLASLGAGLVIAGNVPADPDDPTGWQEYASRATVWTLRDDGTSWERTVLPGQTTSSALRDLIEVDGVLHALASGANEARVWRSLDGRTWEALPPLPTGGSGIGGAVLAVRGERLLVLGSGVWLATR